MRSDRHEPIAGNDLGWTTSHNAEATASSADLLAVLFRHKWKAAAAFTLGIVLTAAVILFFPRSYHSEAKLFVRVGRETATLDPTATTGQTVTVQASREREINSILEILRSAAIVDHAVDSIGISEILRKGEEPSIAGRVLAPLKYLKRRFDELDPVTDRERAALLVRDQLRFDAPDATDVVTVSARSSSPESAQTLVARALDGFFVVHARLSRTQRSHEFFESQTDLLHSQLLAASEELRDAKNRYGLLTVDGQREILNQQISSVIGQLATADADLAYARSRANELAGTLANIPAVKVTQSTTGIGNQATDQMRAQLFELEIRENELAARLTENHPSMIALRQQRQSAAEIVKRQPEQRTQTTSAVDETHQTLHIDWLGEQATVAALASRKNSLAAQKAAIHHDLEALNEQAFQVSELEKRVELLAASYKTYVERREEARIDEALEREKISSINLVQRPTISQRPASPHKVAVAAIGLLFAIAAAGGCVIAAEYCDSSFVSSAQIERQLELPVLVSIPRTRRQQRFELS